VVDSVLLECITKAPTEPPIKAAIKATGKSLFVMIIGQISPSGILLSKLACRLVQ
jgi:hypothetical protein